MKKTIITVIITSIICITGTSLAAYKLKAEQVSFDKTNTGLNSNDVQAAIDELATNISLCNSSYEVIGVVSETLGFTKTLEKSYKYIILFDSKSNYTLGLDNTGSTISEYGNKVLIKQIQGNTRADDVYFATATVYEDVPAGSIITLGDLQTSNPYGRLNIAIGIN